MSWGRWDPWAMPLRMRSSPVARAKRAQSIRQGSAAKVKAEKLAERAAEEAAVKAANRTTTGTSTSGENCSSESIVLTRLPAHGALAPTTWATASWRGPPRPTTRSAATGGSATGGPRSEDATTHSPAEPRKCTARSTVGAATPAPLVGTTPVGTSSLARQTTSGSPSATSSTVAAPRGTSRRTRSWSTKAASSRGAGPRESKPRRHSILSPHRAPDGRE